MTANNFIVDVWTGDMGALMILWVMMLPFVAIAAAVNWLRKR